MPDFFCMRHYQLFLLILLLFAGLLLFSGSSVWKKTITLHGPNMPVRPAPQLSMPDGLRKKAASARLFVEQNGYNDRLCFLVDMSLPSGQNRFFVYDLVKDTIAKAGLVTHGRCNEYWLEGRKYGNTVGCGCTSLGKYRIGYAYTGRFGLAYKLYGLEKTNDKAFERFVVLHAHDCVPDSEIKDDICQSDGCPTVAPGFLQQLKPVLDVSRKPVLLWIYE